MKAFNAQRSTRLLNATILAGIVVLFLSSCGNSSQPPATAPLETSPPTSPTPFVDRRPTLPPSWTPTDTPTHTPTPTITHTPTATPTYTTAQICEGLHVSLLTTNTVFTPSDSLPFLFRSEYPNLLLIVTITHLQSQQEEIVTLPGTQSFFGQLSMDFAAGPGSYLLTINANTAAYTAVCERQIQFTLMAEPETTAEATAETTALSVTQTPFIIIVTATSDPETTP